MGKIRICVAGATGWVGRALVPAILKSEDFVLTGAVARRAAGRKICDITGIPGNETTVTASLKEALASGADVLIDYTSPSAVRTNVLKAIENGVNVVIGTSGLTDMDYGEIDRSASIKGVGVFAAGNFSISAALALHFSEIAARYMKSWEILDFASENKVDSPSGTALEMAHRLSGAGKPNLEVPVDHTAGYRESRGATINGIQVHSIRLPGHVLGVRAEFGSPDERLSISFDAGAGPEPYIEGTLLAARKVMHMKGLKRGMDLLLDL